ncbi:MAG: branched-chain amino acid ABC transporter substrate-binding protein, partial [Alphaproteobacteria bacterium]
MDKFIKKFDRRTVLKTGVAGAAVAVVAPTVFVRDAWAEKIIGNFPAKTSGKSVTFGFNVPQTGAYSDEGADELRAYKLAVEHINGGGDGGMLNTMTPRALKGNGILGK